MADSGFASRSHESHRAEWDRQAADPGRQDILQSWFRRDTVDYWRHARMYEPAMAFSHRPDLSCVTIGDGRFGLDSIRLRALGFTSVLPTDIGDGLLSQAKLGGHIDDYAVENAEALSFENGAFDLVFCKESYHHCPRAPLALYEMLRVARHAVLIVEPRDYVIDHGPARTIGPKGLVRGFLNWIRDRVGMTPRPVAIHDRYLTGDTPHFEESGNYMYTVSSRELEKVALGIGLPAIALKGLNDSYVAGGETEPAIETSPVFRSMFEDIGRADTRSNAGCGSTSMLMAVLFKTVPDAQTREFFNTHGWMYRDLPSNPYLK